MAARTKQAIVDDARAIVYPFGISVNGGDVAGAAIPLNAAGKPDMPGQDWQQAMLRLQLLQVELLIDIRG